jgi:hypothetical protein
MRTGRPTPSFAGDLRLGNAPDNFIFHRRNEALHGNAKSPRFMANRISGFPLARAARFTDAATSSAARSRQTIARIKG